MILKDSRRGTNGQLVTRQPALHGEPQAPVHVRDPRVLEVDAVAQHAVLEKRTPGFTKTFSDLGEKVKNFSGSLQNSFSSSRGSRGSSGSSSSPGTGGSPALGRSLSVGDSSTTGRLPKFGRSLSFGSLLPLRSFLRGAPLV